MYHYFHKNVKQQLISTLIIVMRRNATCVDKHLRDHVTMTLEKYSIVAF